MYHVLMYHNLSTFTHLPFLITTTTKPHPKKKKLFPSSQISKSQFLLRIFSRTTYVVGAMHITKSGKEPFTKKKKIVF